MMCRIIMAYADVATHQEDDDEVARGGDGKAHQGSKCVGRQITVRSTARADYEEAHESV
jgi:hypothetical protein